MRSFESHFPGLMGQGQDSPVVDRCVNNDRWVISPTSGGQAGTTL